MEIGIKRYIDNEYVKSVITKRNPYAHKGDFGRVLLVVGNGGMTGAAIFASKAAMRSGAGLVYTWVNLGQVFSSKLLLVIFGYGLIPTVGSYILYLQGLSRKLETSRVPVIASVETIVAAVIGILIFHESASFVKLIGIALVVASIAIMNLNKKDK